MYSQLDGWQLSEKIICEILEKYNHNKNSLQTSIYIYFMYLQYTLVNLANNIL